MSFEKLQADSYCVGGGDRSATTNIFVDITSKGSKVFIGCCLVFNRKNFITVSDNTIAAEVIGDFFMSLGEKGHNLSKSITKHCFEESERALEFSANVGTAFAKPKTAL